MPQRRSASGATGSGRATPDFTLPSADGKQVALHDFAGRKVLLVFTQSGCSPCQKIVPELNRLRKSDQSQVVVVNNGEAEATKKWSAEVGATFPVLAQTRFNISKKYEVFATPFAFLIDEKGVVASKGIINNRQHIRYVLSGKPVHGNGQTELRVAENSESDVPLGISTLKEVSHV